MAVIINDFEVVQEPPATAADGGSENTTTGAQSGSGQNLTPYDIEDISRLYMERAERVRPH